MYELVYCSESEPNLKYNDILNIVKMAREFNKKNNITGCLLFYNNQFVQIIEGEKGLIQRLYKKIEKDNRHEHVILLSQGTKDGRSFPNWSMAFQELRDNELDKIIDKNSIKNLTAFADLAEKPTLTIHVFWSTVKQIIDNENS